MTMKTNSMSRRKALGLMGAGSAALLAGNSKASAQASPAVRRKVKLQYWNWADNPTHQKISTDSVAVAVERVIADGRQWTMADSAEDGVSLARQRGHGAGRRLRLEEQRASGMPAAICLCDCQSTAASCEARCFDTGLKAFTCTPIALDGCSASCTCK